MAKGDTTSVGRIDITFARKEANSVSSTCEPAFPFFPPRWQQHCDDKYSIRIRDREGGSLCFEPRSFLIN